MWELGFGCCWNDSSVSANASCCHKARDSTASTTLQWGRFLREALVRIGQGRKGPKWRGLPLAVALSTSPSGEMTFARETVGKQFGFSTPVPTHHLQFFILKEARLSAQLCFQPNRMLWGQMGKSSSWELFRFFTAFLRHFPAVFSRRQLFQTHMGFMSMGRGLPELKECLLLCAWLTGPATDAPRQDHC